MIDPMYRIFYAGMRAKADSSVADGKKRNERKERDLVKLIAIFVHILFHQANNITQYAHTHTYTHTARKCTQVTNALHVSFGSFFLLNVEFLFFSFGSQLENISFTPSI